MSYGHIFIPLVGQKKIVPFYYPRNAFINVQSLQVQAKGDIGSGPSSGVRCAVPFN